jgi:hypothetical protein
MTRKLSTPKYYKVVRLFSDGVRGSVVVDREDPLFEEYVPGEWMRAKDQSEYGLFVFDDYTAALKWACGMRISGRTDYEIWRVDVEGVRPLPESEADNPHKFTVDALVLRECVRRVNKRTRGPQIITTMYKIVRVDGDAYASISFSEGDVPYVRYRPGRWSYTPKELRRHGYHLCVFWDFCYITRYLWYPGWKPPSDWQVWQCDARGVHEPGVFHIDEDYVLEYFHRVLNKQEPYFHRIPHSRRWPGGTMFARSVRLVKPVPWEEVLKHG